MSQIPNAAYNPTASPVSNSVSFAGSAPVPQQVQIGAGWGDLGAAFSAFSQTLAGVFTQVTKIDRQKAMEEGEQKMMANRTNYRKMVESGEIDPVENPWEALGAASADATMHADRWKAKVREEYQQRVMTDPGFATSVGAAEDFINERMKTELESGLDNPVWQRTFMKDTSAFVTNMSITHADEVVKNRRLRAEEGLVTGILSDYKDWRAVSGDTQIPLHEQFNTRKDEYYQTYGSQLTQDALTKVFIKLREESGDDPAVLAELDQVNLGTGPFTSTAAYKAAEVVSSDRLTAARMDRDSKEMASFIHDAILSGGDVSPEALNRKIKAIRPGIDSTEAATVSSAASKLIDPFKEQVYQNGRNNLISASAAAMVAAYTPVDASGNLPMDAQSILARDPNRMKTTITGGINGLRGRLNMKLGEGMSDKEAETIVLMARARASDQVVQSAAQLKKPDGTPDFERRAQIVTNFAMRAKADHPDAPLIEGGIQNFTMSPTPESARSSAAYGTLLVQTRRAAISMGSSLKSLGFTEETEAFAEAVNSSLDAGSPIEQAMMDASSQVPRPSGIPPMMSYDAISEVATAKFDGMLDGNRPVWQGSQVMPQLVAYMSSTKNRGLGKEMQKVRAREWLDNNVLMTANGTVVIKPEATNGLTQIFTSAEPWNNLQRQYEKVLKSKDPTIKGVRFNALRNGLYSVEVYRDNTSFSQVSSDGINALNEAGLRTSFNLDEAQQLYLKKKSDDADVQENIRRNFNPAQMRNVIYAPIQR